MKYDQHTYVVKCPHCSHEAQHQAPSTALALLAVHFGEMAAETSHDWGGAGWDLQLLHFVRRQVEG